MQPRFLLPALALAAAVLSPAASFAAELHQDEPSSAIVLTAPYKPIHRIVPPSTGVPIASYGA